MSLIPRLDSDFNFTPFFRFLDDFYNYPRDLIETQTFTPKFDIQGHKHAYNLHGELRGVEKKDIEIEWSDPQTICIHDKTEKSYESSKEGEEVEGAKIWRSERRTGDFSCTFAFPKPFDQEGVKATMKNGILNLSVPKAKKELEQKKITIS
ncbi:HSP20-like chaperone [Stipitochalara longipes BDJ]|nr:HSP20-like chaperone [Stipitochalara longipes BDJ]